MRTRMVLVLCAALALTVGVATATAGNGKGGNSANAKLCQKGGWQYLLRADQSAFKNQSDCVSYAAKGGQYYKSATQLLCESYGGTYSTNPNTSVFAPEYPGQRVLWTCNNYTGNPASTTALVNACLFTDGGLGYTDFGVDPDYSTCWKDPFLMEELFGCGGGVSPPPPPPPHQPL
jgi:hypothetical protein